MNSRPRAALIKELASKHGFAYCGIARVEKMHPETERLRAWLDKGYHGKMSYMENHFELRTDPTELVPGAKSLISLLFNYYNPNKQHDPNAPRISMYALGKDYHKVIHRKLKSLLSDIREAFGEVKGRCFVDSGPVLERDWARRAGLGWTGKNTLLIHPKAGSYFFLSEVIVDLELEPDVPIDDHCGTCRRCIDACPTSAISQEGYLLDAGKCISYLTIELRDEHIPDEFRNQMENYAFGCDICQEVCPWNRFSSRHGEPEFEPRPELMDLSKDEWHHMSEGQFEELFEGSAVKRTRFSGLKRNLDFLKPNSRD